MYFFCGSLALLIFFPARVCICFSLLASICSLRFIFSHVSKKALIYTKLKEEKKKKRQLRLWETLTFLLSDFLKRTRVISSFLWKTFRTCWHLFSLFDSQLLFSPIGSYCLSNIFLNAEVHCPLLYLLHFFNYKASLPWLDSTIIIRNLFLPNTF